MADFCFDCTLVLAPEWAPSNDMTGRHDAEIGLFTLCEGCGFHLFDYDGRRICRRSQAEFTIDDIGLEPCPRCRLLRGSGL